jgi:hypothetical protein
MRKKANAVHDLLPPDPAELAAGLIAVEIEIEELRFEIIEAREARFDHFIGGPYCDHEARLERLEARVFGPPKQR